MINRRTLIMSGMASLAFPGIVQAHENFKIDPKYIPQAVRFNNSYDAGTIVVHPNEFFLYLVESSTWARRYGVRVGRAGLAWKGEAIIERKAEWPRWTPTANMIRREPEKYAQFAGGMAGGPNNPLGARALYLYRNGRDTLYRIHGTNQPWTIGSAVSNGCVGLINDHVKDLYDRVPAGTKVIVL
ncbi:MAG TPA: L,D-transpeptidase [Devosia sp.]|nr:L,D-transpeptidase [Devosia sp.]